MESALEETTKTSYVISTIIAKGIKPFTDAEYAKEGLNAEVGIVCSKKKSENTILSCRPNDSSPVFKGLEQGYPTHGSLVPGMRLF